MNLIQVAILLVLPGNILSTWNWEMWHRNENWKVGLDISDDSRCHCLSKSKWKPNIESQICCPCTGIYILHAIKNLTYPHMASRYDIRSAVDISSSRTAAWGEVEHTRYLKCHWNTICWQLYWTQKPTPNLKSGKYWVV